ncbi:MAG: LacI family DNA-binding transcriptional regulator [Chloroflexi bacterium]|nr:LacI family DNA-binding transcriptional regulator [Chloroflexota bacterium]
MREVAGLAEVAISSVSRVLSGHPDVSAAMRDRVLAAVAQLDYEPDVVAQSLRRGATLSVGYVVGDISNPLHAGIISGAESVLRAAGYSMLLVNSENEPALDATHVRLFQKRRVDGMILSLASETHPDTLRALANVGVPFVVVDRELPADLGASSVRNDHRPAIRAAVEHLLELGHRRIALVTGSLDLWPVRERVAGMHEAIEGRGIADETVTMAGSLSANHGAAATRDLIRRHLRPTAIIAGGNQILAGCLRAVAEAGLRIPGDLSLVTCDDTDLSELFDPPIACIRRDISAIGRIAGELLLERLAGAAAGDPVTLPTTFVRRASCATPPRD